jgi:peptidoglycan/xylan/chitin deacetylase (PgdA/CDA1 family)
VNNYQKQLTPEVRADIIAAHRNGAKATEIAKAYRMPPGVVSGVLKGQPRIDRNTQNLARARLYLAREAKRSGDRIEIEKAIAIIDRLISAPS